MRRINQCFFLASLAIAFFIEPIFNTKQMALAAQVEKIHRKNIKAFEEIQDAIELKDYEAATKLIDKLLVSRKLNDLEWVYTTNYRAHICLANNDLECSTQELEKILEKKSGVPKRFYYQAIFALANINFKQENYSEFLVYADEYLATLPSMMRSKNILLGQSYFAAQNYDRALSFVLARLESDSSSSQYLESQWLYFLIKIYKELNQLESALEFIDSMDELNPKTQYKLKVAQSFAELGMQKKAQLLREDLLAKGLAGYKDGKLIVWNTEGDVRPIFRPAPIYPRRAMKLRQEGWVDLRMDIDQFGKTQNIRIVKSSVKKVFDKAAVNAAKGYIYNPIIKDGVPAELKDYEIRIGFEIDDRKK